jgi:iron-sulfur cluster repair protein YtfE (RIC family)
VSEFCVVDEKRSTVQAMLSNEYVLSNHRLRAAFKEAPVSETTWNVEKSMLKKLLAEFIQSRESAYSKLIDADQSTAGHANLVATVRSNFKIVTAAVKQYLDRDSGIELERFQVVKKAIDSHLSIEEQIVFPVLERLNGAVHV